MNMCEQKYGISPLGFLLIIIVFSISVIFIMNQKHSKSKSSKLVHKGGRPKKRKVAFIVIFLLFIFGILFTVFFFIKIKPLNTLKKNLNTTKITSKKIISNIGGVDNKQSLSIQEFAKNVVNNFAHLKNIIKSYISKIKILKFIMKGIHDVCHIDRNLINFINFIDIHNDITIPKLNYYNIFKQIINYIYSLCNKKCIKNLTVPGDIQYQNIENCFTDVENIVQFVENSFKKVENMKYIDITPSPEYNLVKAFSDIATDINKIQSDYNNYTNCKHKQNCPNNQTLIKNEINHITDGINSCKTIMNIINKHSNNKSCNLDKLFTDIDLNICYLQELLNIFMNCMKSENSSPIKSKYYDNKQCLKSE